MRPHPGRAGHPKELRERAAALRRSGASRARVADDLEVGSSTVARWFRKDGVVAPHSDPRGPYDAQLDAVRDRWQRQQVEQDRHRDAVGPISDRELLLVGAAIYWAEGGKSKPWRRAHHVTFMNSDPTMIMVFLAYLRLLGVSRDRITCRLQIHESADVRRVEDLWREEVGDGVAWMRTALKRHDATPSRHNTGDSYRGCLAIVVRQSASDYRRTAGTWEGIARAASGHHSPVV